MHHCWRQLIAAAATPPLQRRSAVIGNVNGHLVGFHRASDFKFPFFFV